MNRYAQSAGFVGRRTYRLCLRCVVVLQPLLAIAALLIPAIPAGAASTEPRSPDVYPFGEICARTEDPVSCMHSYGFDCHTSIAPASGVGAFRSGCNLPLDDGRMLFVQLLSVRDEWRIEVQRAYVPEMSEPDDGVQSAYDALVEMISQEMRAYSMQSGGSDSSDLFPEIVQFETGARLDNAGLTVRALCGVVNDGTKTDILSRGLQDQCEPQLLRAIRKLSQSSTSSPFRAAGATQVAWEFHDEFLPTGDMALVLEGHISVADGQMPCIWKSDCCSQDGRVFLDSCRTPAESELAAADQCVAQGLKLRSADYVDCLRDNGVDAGCVDQPDGSRLCY